MPKAGKKSEKREEHERQGWYKRARRFRAGIEGRISVMKRRERVPSPSAVRGSVLRGSRARIDRLSCEAASVGFRVVDAT